MERQRREEWERAKKEELDRRRAGEQEEIMRLRAKKRSLELELEAVVSSGWNPQRFSRMGNKMTRREYANGSQWIFSMNTKCDAKVRLTFTQ